ncbi:hypothetical protein [Kitasatospora sp. CMC57]|uniref:hypothetical protein n=1 Tax=Kitasatospora sp. CMC57 TaxID=3231513 RepID=UPI0038B4C85B
MLLVLFHRHGARTWLLADMCAGCARAVPGAAPVDLPEHPAPQPLPEGRSKVRRRGGGEARSSEVRRHAVKAALGYTAASLPEHISGEARLLAVLCVLRIRPGGHIPVPTGWLRSLQLPSPENALTELLTCDSGFTTAENHKQVVVATELASSWRPRAGHRAQALTTDPALRGHSPAARLAALTIAAWCEPGEARCRIDPESTARSCGQSTEDLLHTLTAMHASRWLRHFEQEPCGLLRCAPNQPRLL